VETLTPSTAGGPFDFEVIVSNGCELGIAPFSIASVAAPPTLYIWITAKTYEPEVDFSGVAGADSLCMSDSAKPSGVTTAKAMLVDGVNRIACTSSNCTTGGAAENVNWVLLPNATYLNAAGQTIGTTTSAGIFTSTLSNAVSAVNSIAWTGMTPTWTTDTGATCSAWTSDTVFGEGGYTDSTSEDDLLGAINYNCGNPWLLYCAGH
jgi:hypothetical protein